MKSPLMNEVHILVEQSNINMKRERDTHIQLHI